MRAFEFDDANYYFVPLKFEMGNDLISNGYTKAGVRCSGSLHEMFV